MSPSQNKIKYYMSHIVMVVTTVTHRSNSRSIPALVLPFSADHRASGSPNNNLFSMNRENWSIAAAASDVEFDCHGYSKLGS